ncbi:protein phosphatase 2C domain-containing protein [Klugiella xanthotipulae]|uniref:Protein phosphatase n=1 Tax=Klugiella xanthotipulae TaxID=244735 RepID=A0A543I4K9_9MICO|nr:protein phosphatase 2C domain-containing protein [Klugiella xanthotipulae]TQM65525.1 protein phosphatase [Klugiella xanthotipulae]
MTFTEATSRTRDVVLGAEGRTVTLSWSSATDRGLKRAQNEDSLVALPPIFAVADGMGGHAAGDVASAAVAGALGAITTVPVGSQQLQDALHSATKAIRIEGSKTGASGGSTCVGAALTTQGDDPYWLIFNVGDSRAYIFEDEVLSQVSVDHSVVQEMVDTGEITPLEALSHPQRNMITRAVGFEDAPVPDYWLVPALAGTKVICCSDGLTKELVDGDIAQHIARGGSPQQIVNRLMTAALASGGRDNITIVLVEITSVGPDETDWHETLPGINL